MRLQTPIRVQTATRLTARRLNVQRSMRGQPARGLLHEPRLLQSHKSSQRTVSDRSGSPDAWAGVCSLYRTLIGHDLPEGWLSS